MKALIALVVVISLTGCASTSTNAPGSDRASDYQALGVKLQSALKAPELGPIANKVYLGLDARQTPLHLLTLEERVTDAERPAIAAWHAIRYGEIWAEFDALNVRYQPWLRPIWDLNRIANTTLTAKLYAGEITYGEFNRMRVQLLADTSAASERRTAEVQQAQAVADYADRAARLQGASLALQSYSTMLQNQYLVTPQMQPTRIAPFTCQRMGTMTQCF